MFMPPMKDNIILHVPELDSQGMPVKNRNGVVMRVPVPSKARVQYTSKKIFNSAGEEVTATLEVDLPPTTIVYSGDVVEWVDRFGKVVKTPIAELSEALAADGDKVWFRTALTL